MAQIKFGTDGWRAVIAEDFTFSNVDRVAQATADYWNANPIRECQDGGGSGNPPHPGPTHEPPPEQRAQTPLTRPAGTLSPRQTRGEGWGEGCPPGFSGTMRAKMLGEEAIRRSELAESLPNRQPRVVVGYDRRFLSDQFARRTAEILAGNGFQVTLTSEPTPTPSVSFAVKAQQAIGGVMITASHNPAIFNGFKLKAWYGGSAESAICQAVEQELDKNPVRALELAEGIKAKRIVVKDVRPPHYRAIKRLVDFELIGRSKLRFAHEALYGVGAGCFDQLLAGTTCRVTTLNGAHDPFFGGINPEPVPQNYARSAAYLARHPHDICLVTDGDADRVGGMDGRGRALSTHQLICLLLHHFVVNRRQSGRVVKALTTTSMLDKMCAAHGLELVETAVGFKYIAAEVLKGNVLLGAEESGGIGFPGHIPERDGILAGMMLLELLATERISINKLIARLEREFGPHRYARIDTHYPLEKRSLLLDYCKNNPPVRLLGSPLAEVKSYDGVKFVARDGSWLMLRGSGTEPILRIYAEARSDADARKLLKLGVRLTRQV